MVSTDTPSRIAAALSRCPGGRRPGEAHREDGQQGGGPLAHETVTGAVEPEASHPVPGVPLLGYRIAEGPGRHGLVERGVERGHLREFGPQGADRFDAGQVRRVLQRRQRNERADRGDHVVVHQDRGAEPLAPVHHPVADPDEADPSQAALSQVVENAADDSAVAAIRKRLLDGFTGIPADPQHGAWAPTCSASPPSTRSPVSGVSSANFTDELPELSTSTRGLEPSEPAWASEPAMPGMLPATG